MISAVSAGVGAARFLQALVEAVLHMENVADFFRDPLVQGVLAALGASGVLVTAVLFLVRWLQPKIVERATRRRAVFHRDRFPLPSTGYRKTALPVAYEAAGPEARAQPGAVAKGKGLVVRFQDEERSEAGLGVWLTVCNPSEQTYRWFGPKLTAYAQPRYAVIEPALHQELGGHLIIDLYAGEQYTCYYFFPFTANVLAPKYLTCESWDTAVTFWWARGA